MSIKEYFNKYGNKEKVTNEPDEPEKEPFDLQAQINLNSNISEAARLYQQTQAKSTILGAISGGLGNPGQVIKTGQIYGQNQLVLPFGSNEISKLKSENEKLFVLVKDMLDTLEMIANNTEKDDPNYWLRRGFIDGYLLRIGEIINEKESSNNQAKSTFYQAHEQSS